jgi:hypothetical protein
MVRMNTVCDEHYGAMIDVDGPAEPLAHPAPMVRFPTIGEW